jgi:hypothetical protein
MKSKLLLFVTLLVCSSSYSFSPPLSGEPVPGAEIYIELEPDDEPIANVQTNMDGEFSFIIPADIEVPANGTFSITVTPPKKLNGPMAKNLSSMEKQTIQIQFSKKDGQKFKFTLSWDAKLKTKSNRGGFAVSGRNNS